MDVKAMVGLLKKIRKEFGKLTLAVYIYEKWSDAKLSGPMSLWEKTN
jgi:hypothetical protein